MKSDVICCFLLVLPVESQKPANNQTARLCFNSKPPGTTRVAYGSCLTEPNPAICGSSPIGPTLAAYGSGLTGITQDVHSFGPIVVTLSLYDSGLAGLTGPTVAAYGSGV